MKQGFQTLDNWSHSTVIFERLGINTVSLEMLPVYYMKAVSKLYCREGIPKRASDLTDGRSRGQKSRWPRQGGESCTEKHWSSAEKSPQGFDWLLICAYVRQSFQRHREAILEKSTQNKSQRPHVMGSSAYFPQAFITHGIKQWLQTFYLLKNLEKTWWWWRKENVKHIENPKGTPRDEKYNF